MSPSCHPLGIRIPDLEIRSQEAPFSLSLKRLIVQISPQLTVTRGIYVLPAHRHRIFSDPACRLPAPRDTGLSIAIREMTQASQTTNYTFSLLMMSSLQNFSCIWSSSKQNSRAQTSPQMVTNFCRKYPVAPDQGQ